jgi:hypothetical protein
LKRTAEMKKGVLQAPNPQCLQGEQERVLSPGADGTSQDAPQEENVRSTIQIKMGQVQ